MFNLMVAAAHFHQGTTRRHRSQIGKSGEEGKHDCLPRDHWSRFHAGGSAGADGFWWLSKLSRLNCENDGGSFLLR